MADIIDQMVADAAALQTPEGKSAGIERAAQPQASAPMSIIDQMHADAGLPAPQEQASSTIDNTPRGGYAYSEGPLRPEDANAMRVDIGGTNKQPEKASFGDELTSAVKDVPHQLGLTARYGLEGVGGVVDMMASPFRGAMNAVLPEQYAAQPGMATRLADAIGLPQPVNEKERLIGDAARSVAGAAVPIGLAGQAAKGLTGTSAAVADILAANPTQQFISAAGAGAAGGVAREAGIGEGGQFVASLAGGIAAPMAVMGGQKALSAALNSVRNGLDRSAVANAENSAIPTVANQPVSSPVPNFGSKINSVVPDYVNGAAPEVTPIINLERQSIDKTLTAPEQMQRAEVLRRIGLTNARESAITGDSAQGATQAQIAKFVTEPTGLAAKDLFDSERAALQDHAQSIIQDTGASTGMDNASLSARGQTIAAAYDGLRQHFDSNIKKLYDIADERSNGMPETNLTNFSKYFKDKSNFEGMTENGALGRGIEHYLREQGIMDSDGSMNPVTSKQAEGIKKYINGQYSHETAGLAAKVKNTIDKDVAKSAGEDIYSESRNLYKQKKETLDNPNGIASLMNFDPRTPINRTTPYEKIPSKLTSLDTAQFGHMVDVLNKVLDPSYNAPPLLQMQAHDALNEIKGQFANEMFEAGNKFQSKWNPEGITKYIKNNSGKLPMVFDNQTLQRISDLNDAGHILSVDKSYPGAVAQASMAVKHGVFPNIVSKSVVGLGGAAGGFLGGVPGAAIGSAAGGIAGDNLARSLGGNATLNKFNEGIIPTNDYAPAPVVTPVETAPITSVYPPASLVSQVANHLESKEQTRQKDAALQMQLSRLKSSSAQQILDDALRATQNMGIIQGATR